MGINVSQDLIDEMNNDQEFWDYLYNNYSDDGYYYYLKEDKQELANIYLNEYKVK